MAVYVVHFFYQFSEYKSEVGEIYTEDSGKLGKLDLVFC